MHVLVLASQKGGAGKTTLAFHLAVAAEASGAGPVVLIDTDPQATLTQWWNKREARTPAMLETSVIALAGNLQQLRENNFGLAIIDTAGRSSEANRAVLEQADFVLLPVKPSAGDLWALSSTLEVCTTLKRPYAFAVCQATRGAAMTIQVLSALSESGPVAPVVIHNRVNYAAAMGIGRTIQEIEPKGPEAGEITELWAFVQKRLPRTGNRASVQGEKIASTKDALEVTHG